MKFTLRRRPWLLFSSASVVSFFGFKSYASDSEPKVASASKLAISYLNSLSDSQKAKAKLDFNDKNRVDWHFIPLETRKGIPFRELNADQLTLAIELLGSLLSKKGLERTLDIMSYEAILLELEGPSQAKRRDYKKFYLAIYGEPNNQSLWGLSVEGHHLSLNFTIDSDAIVDSTPQFFGVNPAELRKDFTTPSAILAGKSVVYTKGNRLLAPEEDRGFGLLQSLDQAQLQKAVYSQDCPDDIRWAGEPQPKVSEPEGISAYELSPAQRRDLKALIDTFLTHMPAAVVEQRWKLIEKAGFDKIVFGWSGSPKAGEQHFFKVQGPTFIAEFCNYQSDPEGNVANHIHSIWRDMTGDFNLPLSPG